MSSLRLKAMPAALVAAGIMAASSTVFALGQLGIPSSIAGVYAQGTFAPTSYMVVSRNMYAPLGTDSATATGGYIALLLKPAQTAWGYGLTTGSSSNDTGNAPSYGTATLTGTLTTGTTSCTVTYENRFDVAGTIAVSVMSMVASPATGTTTCKTAFANQTGLPSGFFAPTGGDSRKTFNLIY